MKEYLKPLIEEEEILIEDVIATSGLTDGGSSPIIQNDPNAEVIGG